MHNENDHNSFAEAVDQLQVIQYTRKTQSDGASLSSSKPPGAAFGDSTQTTQSHYFGPFYGLSFSQADAKYTERISCAYKGILNPPPLNALARVLYVAITLLLGRP